AIIGVGNLGSTLARHLVAGDEHVVLAANDQAHADALAAELGPNASAASIEDALTGADVVVLAVWLAQDKELVPAQASLLENKVVADPSNPIGFENGQMVRDAPGRSVGGLDSGRPPPPERALREGIRHAWRRLSREQCKPRTEAGGVVLRDRRRRRRRNC